MYETGVLVAFLVWVVNVVYSIAMINSQLERNMNKIGQRFSWLSLTMKPMSQADVDRSAVAKIVRFAFIQFVALVWCVTSWLSVASSVGQFIWRKSKDSGAPQAVRELRWKLRNQDLSFDQIVLESMKVTNVDSSQFAARKAATIEQMEEAGLTPRY